MPPMPMAARFSLLLGASCPSTRLGTMAADSAAMAAVDVNCLRETVRVESSLIRESSVAPGSHLPATEPPDATVKRTMRAQLLLVAAIASAGLAAASGLAQTTTRARFRCRPSRPGWERCPA